MNRVVAIVHDNQLCAPAPGWFTLSVAADHLVAPDDIIGELDMLGRIAHVVAPNVRGLVADASVGRRAVGYGDMLCRIIAATSIAGVTATPDHHASTDGLVFRAPTSGRFYGRPSPDKPPFVSAGSELAPGTTICLLEVMKTFNRVTYSGAPVRVRDVLVAEGADVNAGEPLLALEAL